MKLGVAIDGEKAPSPSEVVEEFYDQGIKIIELEYDERFTLEEIKQIKDFNLDLSIHCPSQYLRLNFSKISFLLNTPRFYFSKSQIKHTEKGFSVAEKLEATHYVIHGGIFPRGYFKFERLRKNNKLIKTFITAFKPLFIKAKDNSIKIVLENLTKGNLFSDVSDIMNVQKVYPWSGFCLDFAHSELTNQTDLLTKLKMDHAHISDNNLVTDTHLPLGTGKMKFAKLKRILQQQNFDGKLIAECQNIENAVASFKYLKKHFKSSLIKEY